MLNTTKDLLGLLLLLTPFITVFTLLFFKNNSEDFHYYHHIKHKQYIKRKRIAYTILIICVMNLIACLLLGVLAVKCCYA